MWNRTKTMAASDKPSDESLYPIAVLIDELKNEDIQVSVWHKLKYTNLWNTRLEQRERKKSLKMAIQKKILVIIVPPHTVVINAFFWQRAKPIKSVYCACGISRIEAYMRRIVQ